MPWPEDRGRAPRAAFAHSDARSGASADALQVSPGSGPGIARAAPVAAMASERDEGTSVTPTRARPESGHQAISLLSVVRVAIVAISAATAATSAAAAMNGSGVAVERPESRSRRRRQPAIRPRGWHQRRSRRCARTQRHVVALGGHEHHRHGGAGGEPGRAEHERHPGGRDQLGDHHPAPARGGHVGQGGGPVAELAARDGDAEHDRHQEAKPDHGQDGGEPGGRVQGLRVPVATPGQPRPEHGEQSGQADTPPRRTSAER
jgi:hypothetical protein